MCLQGLDEANLLGVGESVYEVRKVSLLRVGEGVPARCRMELCSYLLRVVGGLLPACKR